MRRLELIGQDSIKSIGAREDEAGIARHLYRVLREFDDSDVAYIYSSRSAPPNGTGYYEPSAEGGRTPDDRGLRSSTVKRFNKLIFVDEDDNSRAPMAKIIMKANSFWDRWILNPEVSLCCFRNR